MNKVLALALCCLLFASATAMTTSDNEAKYVIDQATDVLQQLLGEAHQNLDDLQANWAVQQPILQANIDSLQVQLDNKTAECQHLDGVLAADEAELDNARRYVAWLLSRIAQNEAQIAQIASERCTASNNHIESIKNDKIALSLVEFLRVQIENKDSFDFAQRKSFMHHLQSFLAVYRRGNLSELIQLQKQVASDYEVNVDQSVHGRTSDEIGSHHVDNNQAELDLDGFESGERQQWGDIKAEFLEILTGLEITIKTKIAHGQEDEIRAAVAAAELKLKLEHEIEVYHSELAKWNLTVTRLEGVVAQDQTNVATCRTEESNLEAQLEGAHHDLENATNEFNHKQSNFEEEIEVFAEVLALYNVSTGEQGEDFKARADDYVDNGNFDNGAYNDREVPDYDLLNH